MSDTTRNTRKVRTGVVTSIMGNKAIVVQITERKPHPKYGKMMTSTKKLHVRDEENTAGIGDTVRVMETARCPRPSAGASWRSSSVPSKAFVTTNRLMCRLRADAPLRRMNREGL